jgi:hypothetical protein
MPVWFRKAAIKKLRSNFAVWSEARMQAEPMVSVVMPAYNAAHFIQEAIQSVLAQTYPHFELLVIDDGSTDNTGAVAAACGEGDPRLRVLACAHRGIAASRNAGLQWAGGQYLAWLDADDLSLPGRLEAQVAALDSDPTLVIVGSAFCTIDDRERHPAVQQMPETDTAIRWHGLFHNPFVQSSVMVRLETLRSHGLGYDLALPLVEDYDLWSRLLQHGRGRNLPEPWVRYRLHHAQASRQSRDEVWDLATRVSQRNLADLGAPLSAEKVSRLRAWYYQFPRRFSAADLPLADTLLDILERFLLRPGLEGGEVQRLRGRWLGRLLRAGAGGWKLGWVWRLSRRMGQAGWRDILACQRSRRVV